MELNPFENLPVAELLQNFSTFYGTWRFIYLVANSPLMVPILSHTNPAHTTPPSFSEIHLNIILYKKMMMMMMIIISNVYSCKQ
jgi:hypothetical protein